MPEIAVSGLTKRFGAYTAISGIDFLIPDGSFTTLLGPSGCGKTTTLRILAGFEKPDEGSVRIGNAVVADATRPRGFIPPQGRRLGVVFQSYALWPHMTVFDQIAYPLRVRRHSRAEISQRVNAALDLVQLPNTGSHFPGELSGGQQQRVAMARALVIEPAVLLLDEPMSNLDAELRSEMRDELAKLHRRLKVTTVYVTHDQSEALALSDQVLVMRKGVIVERGTPGSIYESPTTEYSARFVGASNVLDGWFSVKDSGEGLVVLSSGHRIRVPMTHDLEGLRDSGVSVVIKPEDVAIAASVDDRANTVPATVEQSSYLGSRTELSVLCEGRSLRISAPKSYRPQVGEEIVIGLPMDCLRVLPRKVAGASKQTERN